MDYFKLLAGVALLLIFTWLVIQNRKRKRMIDSILSFDTILLFIAGCYLIITSIISLLE